MNPFTLDKSIPRSVRMLEAMANPAIVSADKAIPLALLRRCEGVAFIRLYKAGLFFLGGNVGGGCVICKIPDSTQPDGFRWSAPVAIQCGGLGGGFVFGGEQIDSVILLNTKSAIRAFTGRGQITFGGNVSLAVGPVGKDIGAQVGVSDNKELIAAYSYSQARGAYIGGTLEGAFLIIKDDENKRFYGSPNATAENLLSGSIQAPFSAQALANELYMIVRKEGAYATKGSLARQSASQAALAQSGRDLVRQGMSGGEVLPVNWESATSPDGKTYYYNVVTNETSWDKPKIASAAATPPPPPPSFPPAAPAPAATPPPPPPSFPPAAPAPAAQQQPVNKPGYVPTANVAQQAPKVPANRPKPAVPSTRPNLSVPSKTALYDYSAQQHDELSFRQGDRVEILGQVDPNWAQGRVNGKTGLVPLTYLQ